ncbi:xylulokinase [Homoserinibacter sp. YIM 151385]|uniref:xylulokinase n=1 Tax=Homoserinibacter sp. YIM 151385 TaxID=2985506 RepID=UPI0022F01093|nr:FGGY-family carbohydrate kinase [Homoserinibacter sp. YIM 151385]WBU36848.1 FGGY-family carbohydrate kinase [Homoserinibacter sp. YIM 151385]
MSTAPRAVVAVDVGTSAVRAALVDADRGLLRSTRVARGGAVGGELFDAELLLEEVRRALAELEVQPGEAPAALAISAHIGTVAVDAELRPVVPGGGWADPRGLGRLHGLPPEELAGLLAAAGRPAASGGALALALELRAAGLGDRVAALLSPKDLLVARLTGELATDTVDAAYTLASDIRRRDWQGWALEAAGIPAAWVPRQLAPHETAGALRPAEAARCGLPAGTRVVAGGPDGSVGIGLLLGERSDEIADVAGTTDVIGRLIDDPAEAPSGAIVNPALAPGRWTAGGATGMTGGAVARWRALLGPVDDAGLAAVPAGCRGLLVVPSLSGGRFPRWDAGSRGAVVGQSPDHGPAEFLRAAQEGATSTVREGIDLLDPAPLGARRAVVLAGGSARSEHLVRLRADALGRTLRVASDPDATLLGAAGLALVGAGLAGGLDEARERLGVRLRDVDPEEGAARRYDEIHRTWQEVRDRTSAPGS